MRGEPRGAAAARAVAPARIAEHVISEKLLRLQLRDWLAGRAAFAHPDRPARPADALWECAQRLREPPARRAAKPTQPLALLVEDVKADHRSPRSRRGMQSRMIGEAQIVSKPDNAGRHRWARHSGQ